MNPGHATLCRGCQHFSASGWNMGHANPCYRNRWVGTKHHSPALASDGRQCEDFQEQATPAKDSSLKPHPEEPNSPKSDVERTPQEGIKT